MRACAVGVISDVPLTSGLKWIETVGVELVKAGIVFAGIDVIGDYLTEINVTSPTGIVEIARQSGHDAAKPLLDAFERLARSR